MVDAAIIHQCADLALKPAIVEKFIQAVGVSDPFAVTVRSGNRVVLVTPPKTPEEAMDLARRYVGQAMVRIGVTQYPAGLGISDVSELKPDLVETCANIRMGTALFGKVYRIVVKWYGTPTDQAFGDALDAWKTGYFDGKYVFDEPDPGKTSEREPLIKDHDKHNDADGKAPADTAAPPPSEPGDPNKADIRIDLKGIGVGISK